MKDEKARPSPGVSGAHLGVPDDPRHPDTIALHVQLACIWEATAKKPGNANPRRDLPGLTFVDFLAAGAAIAPVMRNAPNQSIGAVILEAVKATRGVAATNVNLGIILLLAPLAVARRHAASLKEWQAKVAELLDATTVADTRDVYAAIRLAEPGGMGQVKEQDVRTEPTVTLKEAMALAAGRDRIAWQYANRFDDVFRLGPAWLEEGLAKRKCLEDAILHVFFRWLVLHPDTLILRKHGEEDAGEASRRARVLLEKGWKDRDGRILLGSFEAWCQDPEGHRNPGTSADLTAASLFVALSTGIIPLPLRIPWSRE